LCLDFLKPPIPYVIFSLVTRLLISPSPTNWLVIWSKAKLKRKKKIRIMNSLSTMTREGIHSIVLKPGPARRVDPGPGRPGAGTGPGWRKNRGRKNPVWPGGSTRWPGKTRWQTRWLLFFFFTKTTSFWFFF
jgi:hypothetical protein